MFLKASAALAVALALAGAGTAHAAQGLYVDTTLGGWVVQARPPLRALWIDGKSYVSGSEASPDTFVKLDEHTLARVATGTHETVRPSAGTITIGIWENRPFGGYRSGSAIWIGTTQVAVNGSDEAFSPSVGNATTRLRGWLEPAPAKEHAAWVDSDMLQVRTRLPSDTPTRNTIEVGDERFTKTLGPGQTGGWQLVALDHNGTPMWNQLFPLTGDATADANAEDHLAAILPWIGGAGTWAVQAFGDVPAVPASSELATTLQSLGGRADVVDRFDGTKDPTNGVYALLSGRSTVAATAWSSGFRADEASAERIHDAGSLSELLVRDATDNSLIPLNRDVATTDDPLALAYAPPTSWTDWIRTRDGGRRAPTEAERAAYADLVAQVVQRQLVPAVPLCEGAPDALRGYYCDTSAHDLSSLNSYVSGHGFDFDADTAGGRYGTGDWDTVRASIEAELADAEAIRGDIAHYQALFGTAALGAQVNANQIGDAVKGAIKGTTAQTTANVAGILGALTTTASAIPAVAPLMTFMTGAFGLMANLEPDTDTSTVLDRVQVTQNNAAAILADRMQAASTRLSRYGDVLVSDPRKLQEGATYFRAHNPPTTGSDNAFVVAGTYAARQFLWGTMLATRYAVWTSPAALGVNPACTDEIAGHGDVYPFENLDASARWLGPDASTSWLPASDGLRDIETNQKVGLPKSVSDAVFAAPDPRRTSPTELTAGAVLPYFYLQYLPFTALPQAAKFGRVLPVWGAGCHT